MSDNPASDLTSCNHDAASAPEAHQDRRDRRPLDLKDRGTLSALAPIDHRRSRGTRERRDRRSGRMAAVRRDRSREPVSPTIPYNGHRTGHHISPLPGPDLVPECQSGAGVPEYQSMGPADPTAANNRRRAGSIEGDLRLTQRLKPHAALDAPTPDDTEEGLPPFGNTRHLQRGGVEPAPRPEWRCVRGNPRRVTRRSTSSNGPKAPLEGAHSLLTHVQ